MNRPSIALLVILAAQGHLAADVVYDESVSGDLSNSSVAPTSLGTIGDPVLLVKGSVQTPVDTRDYFTFTILLEDAVE